MRPKRVLLLLYHALRVTALCAASLRPPAAWGVLLMWVSDIAVACITLALLLSEARGVSRQGCAHALIRAVLGRGRGAGAGATGTPAPPAELHISVGSGSELPPLASVPTASAGSPRSASISIARDAVIQALGVEQEGGRMPAVTVLPSRHPPPAAVSAFASATPAYSLRWMAADAAVALAVALAQVAFIGLL